MIIVGAISFFGGRGASEASRQGAFNEMAKNLTDDLRIERDHCLKQFAIQEQFNRSLIEQLQRAGIAIVRPTNEPYYLLDGGKVEQIDG